MNIALLTAAGIGNRTNQDIPKQFIHVNNIPIIIYTLRAFQNHPSIDSIVVVGLKGWIDVMNAYAKQFNISKLKTIIEGGETGQASISRGIQEISKWFCEDDVVIIHDGNRPLVSHEVISDALSVYSNKGSAVAAIPCTEAIFVSLDGISSSKTLRREELYRTQTPHVYSLRDVKAAHDFASINNIQNTTATCNLMCLAGKETYFSKGSEKNIKITTTEDIEIFKALLNTVNDSWIK